MHKLHNKNPPKNIPSNLLNKFTMGGRIETKKWYLNNTYPSKKPKVYTKKQINHYIKKVKYKKVKIGRAHV